MDLFGVGRGFFCPISRFLCSWLSSIHSPRFVCGALFRFFSLSFFRGV